MPTNPHPRRFSYASVVSGAVDESTSNQQHLYGTSASPETTDTNYQRSASSIRPLSTTAIYSPQLLPSATTTTTASAHRHFASLATTDADMQMNYGASGAGWRRPGGLPAYSRQFANLPEYAGAGAVSTTATTTTTIHSGPAAINLPTSTSSPAVMLSTSSNSASSPSSSSLSPLWDASFFVPSYLRNSRYIARLEAVRRSKLAVAQREYSSAHMHQQQSHQTQQQGQQSQQTQQQQIQQQSSLSASSASSSHVNLHRMAPSHRGMTYDIVEKEPMTSTSAAAAAAALEDRPQPLPSRWNENDKHDGLDLTNDGMEVRYLGHVHKPDHEAASVRSDFPMPREGGIYYFEATILNKPKDAVIAIGFSSSRASLERLPGWDSESWAYHGDDGKAFVGEGQGQGRPFGPTFALNDTVGCGVNFSTGSAFFTKNGILIGTAFKDLPVTKSIALYPSIGMKRHNGIHVRANFGQQPFMYEIDGLVKKEKLTLIAEIGKTSTAKLQPPLDETTLLQELVAQFLAQEGYYETARSFAEEVRQESMTLENGQTRSLYDHEPGEDIDTANRQKIRAAILEGDMDKALKFTNAYFPKVLQDNPHILFKLRCRKFLEMMCMCSEFSSSATNAQAVQAAQAAQERNGEKGVERMEVDDDDEDEDEEENGDDVESQEEEEEEEEDEYSAAEGMETEEAATVVPNGGDTARFHELLTEAVQYGQQLRMDYPSDEHGGDKQYLDDIFSLVAYPDPRSSVHGHHLDASGRVAVADDLNAAILVSLGKSSTAALETLLAQTEVLVNELSEDGGVGAFLNIRNDFVL